jgi:hypothetical protein
VKDGYPSVAGLASQQNLWAVRNLVRRGLVEPEEFALSHDGKTTMGWVKEHGDEDLARELAYFFPVC